MSEPFLEPRLIGKRFEDHTVPVEILQEWAAYEELVIELARRLFLGKNPSRQRVPRGFFDEFHLHVSKIGAGSAVLELANVRSEGFLIREEVTPYFRDARDLINDVISAVAADQPIPSTFPPDLSYYFNRFGRSLEGGESIELATPENGRAPARFTSEVRKRLVLRTAKEYEKTFDLIGKLIEADTVRLSFQFAPEGGGTVPGRFSESLKVQVAAALFGSSLTSTSNDQVGARLRGTGVFDRDDRLTQIKGLDHIEPFYKLGVYLRLKEIKKLSDGWLDGRGRGFDSADTSWLSDNLSALENLPTPYLYPTEDGNVQAEWTVGDWEVTSLFNLGSRVAILHALNVQSFDEQSLELSLSDKQAWKQLTEFVEKLDPGSDRNADNHEPATAS